MKTPRTWQIILAIACLAMIMNLSSAYAAGQAGEYLAYQEPPQPAGTSWLSTISYLFTLVLTFALVIGLAYFTSRFLGQKMGRFTSAGDHRIVVNLPLGPNRAVQIVEIAGKYLVLGVTDHNITLLQEINDPVQIERLRATAESATPPTQFDAVFQRHLASLQQMSSKFPGVFSHTSRNDNENDREKR